MALPREREVPQQGSLFVPQNSSSPQSSNVSSEMLAGQLFFENYQLWMDNSVVFQLPQGRVKIYPDLDGLESRYEFLLDTFGPHARRIDISGAYAEIMGGFILQTMVEQATHGEYTVIPTPPQLDVTGRRKITFTNGEHAEEKTADIVLGRVIQDGQTQVIEPYMLFDIKSSPRGGKTSSKIDVGVNIGLDTPLPVGIVYVGGLEMEDKEGRLRSARDYVHGVIYPNVLDNHLAWSVLWPGKADMIKNPQARLFSQMCQEILLSCQFTREKIEDTNWRHQVKNRLLGNITLSEELFERIKKEYSFEEISTT